jgi:Protein of unknown function (DUF664)
MTVDRPEPPDAAPERQMLDGWLDFQRATLARKCDGLTTGQLRERAVPPSNLSSLRWIMIHMIEEYARPNGHADLLRERIDGTVGV